MKTLLKLATALISLGIMLPSFADTVPDVVVINTIKEGYDVRFDNTIRVPSTGQNFDTYIFIPYGKQGSPDWAHFNPDDFLFLRGKIEYRDPIYGVVITAGPTCRFGVNQFSINSSYKITVTLHENHNIKKTVCDVEKVN